MNIFEKLYVTLLCVIIVFLTILVVQSNKTARETERINETLTTFTGWLNQNYNAPLYEENNP